MDAKITIIGGGNLGSAIGLGLLKSGYNSIKVTRRNVEKSKNLTEKGILVSSDNLEAIRGAEIIILAIKPFQIKDVLTELKDTLTENQILVSVVTGFSIASMQAIINNNMAIYRAMPNTAIAIQQSVTCIAKQNAGKNQTELVTNIFNSLGKAIYIDESQMAAATVLGASGIAFALRFISAATKAGVEVGFKADVAQQIAAQMVKGAAEMALGDKHPEEEIDRVTTPNGCTIVGLNAMEHNGFSSAVIQGIVKGTEKVHLMAKENE